MRDMMPEMMWGMGFGRPLIIIVLLVVICGSRQVRFLQMIHAWVADELIE